ncbi:MAG: pyridoxamine 5'-phosphate oxidase family protein [bacterium]|nr:pyridoxamine 5'-phosphate oxidase family protein [bacterium]
MAVKLGPDVRDALAGDMTPKFLATLDADGHPNCVPIISITPYDDETLVFGEFLMNKSRRNLLANDKVGVAVLTDALEGWSLKGTFLGFETKGERVDFVNNLPLLRYNAYTGVRAAGTIRVEEVSRKHTISKLRLLMDYARLRAMGPFLARERNGSRCMPRLVEEKFKRMQAIRTAAYRDADGYPRAFPMMACVAAGSARLLMSDPLANAYQSAIPHDTELAVAAITTEPVAYQVKGRYQGAKAGVGVIDLDACYSASPPLLGERLDR